MREEIKIKILENLLEEITKRYDYFISKQEEKYKETYEKAVKDSLTGLYNRFYFLDSLRRSIIRTKRKREKVFIIFVDLDNFKPINDYFGHIEGDKVLKEVAKILKENFREYDIVSRFGGDEFLVLFVGEELPIDRVEKIKKIVEDKFKKYHLSFSYGISVYPDDIKEKNLYTDNIIKKLLKIADERMYKMKEEKKEKSRNT